MGDLSNYKNKLKKLLGEAKIGRVVQSLENNIDRHSEIHTEFIGILSRYNSLEKEKSDGTLSNQEARHESNSIHKALLSMIIQLEDEDMIDFRMYREKLEDYEKLIKQYEHRFEEINTNFLEIRKEFLDEIEDYKTRLKEISDESQKKQKIYLKKIEDLEKSFELEVSDQVKINLSSTILKLKRSIAYLFYKEFLHGKGSYIIYSHDYLPIEKEMEKTVRESFSEEMGDYVEREVKEKRNIQLREITDRLGSIFSRMFPTIEFETGKQDEDNDTPR